MAGFDISGTAGRAQTLGTGETGRVRPSGELEVGTGPAVAMAGPGRLFVAGRVSVDYGPSVFAEGDGLAVTVRESGIVRSPYVFGLHMLDARDFAVTNAGTISGGVAGIFFAQAFSGRIVNEGLIAGWTAIDIWGISDFASGQGTVRIENDGTIRGGSIGLRMSEGALDLVNRGTIASQGLGEQNAAIRGTANDDTIVNAGRIRGLVELTGGDNLFDGRKGVQSEVVGGTGSDTIRGGRRDEVLRGGEGGDNRLFGGGGDDVLHAGKGGGSNLLAGQGGNDVLHGGSGDDVLRGGPGRDILHAVAGDNMLFGGAGRDTLISGLGRDQMTGGPQADVFVFAKAAHAGRGASRDVIADFKPGTDTIDLSGILAKRSFDFVGASAFGGAPGELRYDQRNGILQGDTNGDGTANFAIEFANRPWLEAGDFLL